MHSLITTTLSFECFKYSHWFGLVAASVPFFSFFFGKLERLLLIKFRLKQGVPKTPYTP